MVQGDRPEECTPAIIVYSCILNTYSVHGFLPAPLPHTHILPHPHTHTHTQMPYHRSRHSTTSTISPTNSAYSRRHSSISHPPPTLPSLTLLTPPLESAELLVKFLKVSYQLERLKVEWGLKILGSKAIKNKIELTVVEDAYRNRVYNWARKWVAKQQIRELNRMQIETVSY